MAIEIRERFEVQAPIDQVWRFVIDPRQVVLCMPGAQLDEVVDEMTFLGAVKVRLGAITTSYQGRVRFTEVDKDAHVVRMIAEGREAGGGTATGRIENRLRALSDGHTEFATEARLDLTGRVMQVGRGMIQGVSQQLFRQFAAAAKQRLETPDGAAAAGAPAQPEAIRLVPLALRTLWSAMLNVFRRLFRARRG